MSSSRQSPIEKHLEVVPFSDSGHGPSQESQDKRIHQWIQAQGRLAAPAGDPLHLAAMALMSGSYFLAAVPHSHGIWRFSQAPVSEFYARKYIQLIGFKLAPT
jgi:acyl-CoA thioesterase